MLTANRAGGVSWQWSLGPVFKLFGAANLPVTLAVTELDTCRLWWELWEEQRRLTAAAGL